MSAPSSLRLANVMRRLAFIVGAAACLALIWPQSLGGPVAYVQVNGHSMDPTMALGDLAIVRRHASYRVGDVVAYKIPKGEFGAGAEVIHRIIAVNAEDTFVTQGDNKPLPDPWRPKATDVVGKAWLRVPGAGTKLAKVSAPLPLGVLCGALCFMAAFVRPSRSPLAGLAR